MPFCAFTCSLVSGKQAFCFWNPQDRPLTHKFSLSTLTHWATSLRKYNHFILLIRVKGPSTWGSWVTCLSVLWVLPWTSCGGLSTMTKTEALKGCDAGVTTVFSVTGFWGRPHFHGAGGSTGPKSFISSFSSTWRIFSSSWLALLPGPHCPIVQTQPLNQLEVSCSVPGYALIRLGLGVVCHLQRCLDEKILQLLLAD